MPSWSKTSKTFFIGHLEDCMAGSRIGEKGVEAGARRNEVLIDLASASVNDNANDIFLADPVHGRCISDHNQPTTAPVSAAGQAECVADAFFVELASDEDQGAVAGLTRAPGAAVV